MGFWFRVFGLGFRVFWAGVKAQELGVGGLGVLGCRVEDTEVYS